MTSDQTQPQRRRVLVAIAGLLAAVGLLSALAGCDLGVASSLTSISINIPLGLTGETGLLNFLNGGATTPPQDNDIGLNPFPQGPPTSTPEVPAGTTETTSK